MMEDITSFRLLGAFIQYLHTGRTATKTKSFFCPKSKACTIVSLRATSERHKENFRETNRTILCKGSKVH